MTEASPLTGYRVLFDELTVGAEGGCIIRVDCLIWERFAQRVHAEGPLRATMFVVRM